jgi:taurine dioxygenase
VPPGGGGDTMFASMHAAYDALLPRMQSYLSGLIAAHEGRRVFGPTAPVAAPPVIIKYPVTGKKKVIYVNANFTAKIDELPALEVERVLRFLIDHCTKPEWTYRFHGTAHSIALRDNRCTHHKAIWGYWRNGRSGYRTRAPQAG